MKIRDADRKRHYSQIRRDVRKYVNIIDRKDSDLIKVVLDFNGFYKFKYVAKNIEGDKKSMVSDAIQSLVENYIIQIDMESYGVK